MKKVTAALLVVCTLNFTGCAAMYPQTRTDFVDTMANYDGMMKSMAVAKSETINTPYDQAVSNVETQVKVCIETDMDSRRFSLSSPSTVSQQNRPSFERISNDKAELTLQQWHSGMFGQPENGVYILAADIVRSARNTAQLDVYSSTQYQPVIAAVEEWVKGSKDCHGVGGN